MKKIMIMMMVVSSFIFARDLEHREEIELNRVMDYKPINKEAMARERSVSDENIQLYSQFHNELENMNRGYEDR